MIKHQLIHAYSVHYPHFLVAISSALDYEYEPNSTQTQMLLAIKKEKYMQLMFTNLTGVLIPNGLILRPD